MRLHLHLKTTDLERSIAFYTALFGQPAVVKDDYAKWEPEKFAIIFAVSVGPTPDIDHLGLKGSETEVADVKAALSSAGFCGVEQKGAACCYVEANKHWFVGPSGEVLEIYHGLGSIETFGEDRRPALLGAVSSCCAPSVAPSTEIVLSEAEQKLLLPD